MAREQNSNFEEDSFGIHVLSYALEVCFRQVRIVCNLCKYTLQAVQRSSQHHITGVTRAGAVETIRCQELPRFRLQLRVLGSVRQISMVQLNQQPLRAVEVIGQNDEDHALPRSRISSDDWVRR